ncbi:MAG: GGDEF domain-containing protein, partial [Sphingomonadales bacterium]|nr:GGDEF domain-containing protein [Sphingomonadales bacterium]
LSLRTRLITLVTIILLAGFFATNMLNYQVSKGALRTSVLENELPLSSNNIYSEIQADLLRPVFISSLMANDTFVQDWVIKGEKDPQRMVRYLTQIRDQYKTFTSYFISAKTQRYYHFGGVSKVLDEDDPVDAWFFATRDATEPYVVNVDFNAQQEGSVTIFINYRVTDRDGVFLGVTGVGLQLESVSQLVEAYQKNFRRNVYFVDTKGIIRVHANTAFEGKANIRDIEGLGTIAEDVLENDRGSYAYVSNTDTILLTTRYIPELKWHLFIELPESQALAKMQKGFMRNLAIAPVVILVTILLIVYTINIFQRRLEEMAISDKLTGLKNREFFDVSLTQTVKRFKRDKKTFSLLMIDIDNFKPINDKKGHMTGDKVLHRVGDIILATARESDVSCRWGGDEFAVIASDCTQSEAQRLCEALHTAINAEVIFLDEDEQTITVSIGLTQAVKGDDEAALISRADLALYQANDNGRNRTETL